MFLRATVLRSSKPFFFGALFIFIVALLAAPNLRTAFSANKRGQEASTKKGKTPTGKPVESEPSAQETLTPTAKGKALFNLDVRVNEKRSVSALIASKAATITKQVQSQTKGIQSGLASLREKVPHLDAKASPLTGAVEVLRNTAGALTDASPGVNGNDIVRAFIGNNSSLFGFSRRDLAGLNFIGESVSQGSGLRMVRVEQTVNGLPVFQSESRFILDADGRLFRYTGLMIPNAAASAPALNVSGLISAQDALARAMASVGITVDAARATLSNTNADGTKTEIIANSASVKGNVTSRLVYFPVAPGILLPAWSQITFTDGPGDWYTIVDATTGTLLWRKNIRDEASTQDARFRVYVQADGTTPADSPAPLSPSNVTVGSGTQAVAIAPTIVGMQTVMSVFSNVSQNGWINDCPAGGCTANETQTIGNNVHAYMDRIGGADADIPDTAASSVIDGNGKPTGNPDANGRNRDFLGTTPRDFQTNYLPPPQGGNPEAGQTATGNGNNGTLAVDQFRRGMLTQLFYVSNWYHDRLYTLGFDEAAGNFQQTNFGGQGVGNDRVLAEGQDNTSVDNANFSTPPDGSSGRAQMYRFTGPSIDRDGALDTEVLVHELTHGTSNRLIGNATGLNWDQGRGMGEGWSDFYSLSLLNNTNADDPNANYAEGAYATYKLAGLAYTDNYVYGIRRFPYSTNNSVNPLTWADVDDVTNNLSGGIAPDPLGFNINGGMEVHNIGEVWAMTLWEVRSRVIAANAGDVPTGNQKMLQLITDALKLTPINPSFVDARDAVIDADCATNACANEESIWGGFADRGLGYKAVAPLAYTGRYVRAHAGVGESFAVPYLDVTNGATDVTVDDSTGNNNGSIDPGEPVRITVKLTNPWRSTSKNVASATATLTTSTSGVVINDNTSTYPAIPAQGSAVGDTFQFYCPNSAVAGQALKFTITTTSSLGTKAVNFTLRVGHANGTDPVITYTHTPGTPLTITDNRPRGVFDTLNITDDFEIADVNFRVDSITHVAIGDLTVMLRAPNGYGNDMVALIDGLNDCAGTSITNMVIDDDLPQTAANDMVQATSANAPYTKSWLPVYNSPWAALVDPVRPDDPVGELSRLDGLSTQGNWTALVADDFSAAANGCPAGNGTFSGWSLSITPRHFDVAPFSIAAATAGQLNISEFRLRGPNGSNDEFIEIYNASGTDQTVSASSGTGYGVVASDGTLRCTIPSGTIIPNRGHYLCANSAAYSLAGYAAADATYTTDIPDNAGLALFNSSTTFTLANRLDAVGSTSEANTLYKEGTGYPPLSGGLYNGGINYSFYRDMSGNQGSPKDTDNNAADFLFVDTNGTAAGAGQRLGAPEPENLSSPIYRTTGVPASLIDPLVAQSGLPNRVRDTTPGSGATSSAGTLTLRRTFTNNTGANITRLRFRLVDITTFPAPSGTADLRALTSTDVVVMTTMGNVTARGTTLEQPPNQPNGGGFNSTLSAGTVTLATPIPPGGTVSVQLLFGVQQPGNFRVLLNTERLP